MIDDVLIEVEVEAAFGGCGQFVATAKRKGELSALGKNGPLASSTIGRQLAFPILFFRKGV
jgi:hypothetical protein